LEIHKSSGLENPQIFQIGKSVNLSGPSICNRIRLSDSTIQKSTIYLWNISTSGKQHDSLPD